MTDLRAIAEASNAWPFAEARALLKRLGGKLPEKGYVLFETGYGPSGLPHIGTFGEVARTSMVRHAFSILSDMPTKLFAFSDDMDGLRKVPDNVPHKDLLETNLNKPLTSVPDPFGTHDSFGQHNNARLQAFLDGFGFDYEFKSSTACYRSGQFDDTLMMVLERYDQVMNVILPTLGEERQATYSPFLPISPATGEVLQVPIIKRDPSAGTIVFGDVDGQEQEVPVTGGHVKLQWKPDWAMRWTALGVDYEMSGKDLIESVKQSGKICRIIGGHPPVGFTYELFLDENGEKISKSRGNGLTIEEWLAYAPPESLATFMYQKPTAAKRLHFDVIPKNVDDYFAHAVALERQEDKQKLTNPAWHVHSGTVPETATGGLSFNILLNLASVCNTEDPSVLWHFISRNRSDLTPETAPTLNDLLGFAVNYYRDFVKPAKTYRAPTEMEHTALQDLRVTLEKISEDADAEAIQTEVYEVGKRHDFQDLRAWFKSLYETLLGQSQGPRMGSFIALYGVEETMILIDRILAGETPS